MPVCHGMFGKREADVACRQMGYQTADADPSIIDDKTGSRRKLMPYLVNANCSSNESYLVNYIDLIIGGDGIVESFSATQNEAIHRPNSCDVGATNTGIAVYPHISSMAIDQLGRGMLFF